MIKFIAGCFCGGVLVIVLLVGGLFISYQLYIKPMIEERVLNLDPPPLPSGMESISGVVELLDLDENPVSVALGDGKTLVVNRWATWCPPCVAELPSLAALAARQEELGLQVLCVSDEPVATLKSWRDSKQSNAPIYHLRVMPMEMGKRGVPDTWIIGPSGHVVFKHVGAADWAHDSVIEYLRSLSKPIDQEPMEETDSLEQAPQEEIVSQENIPS